MGQCSEANGLKILAVAPLAAVSATRSPAPSSTATPAVTATRRLPSPSASPRASANPNAQPHANRYANPNADRHADSNVDANADRNDHGDAYGDGDPHGHGAAIRHAQRHADRDRNGQVRNDESGAVGDIQVVGTLYDAAGAPVGCTDAAMDRADLTPGNTTPFSITFATRD